VVDEYRNVEGRVVDRRKKKGESLLTPSPYKAGNQMTAECGVHQ
jgi:hypothetical protein